MEISEAAKRAALSIRDNEIHGPFGGIKSEEIAQQAIDEAIQQDRERHKTKTSDLASINAQQEKEIKRLNAEIERLREWRHAVELQVLSHNRCEIIKDAMVRMQLFGEAARWREYEHNREAREKALTGEEGTE